VDLALSPEQEELARSARSFLATVMPAPGAPAVRSDDEALFAEMAALGWVGLLLPEAHGGGGGTLSDLAVVAAEAGRALAPTVLFSAVAAARLVELAGTEAQRRALLPGLAAGSARATVALHEPDHEELDSLATSLEAAGDGLALVGEKRFVADAVGASHLVVAARRPGEPGVSTLVLVPPGSPGVEVVPVGTFGGDRQAAVSLRRVAVSEEDVLGAPGEGRRPLERVLAETTALQSVEMVGGARRALELAVEHVSRREQFGRTLGTFQAVQHHVADVAIAVDAADLAAWQAVWALEHDRPSTAAVSMAKVAAGDAYRRATLTAFQLCGGAGYVTDHPLHRYADRAKAASLTAGSTVDHLARLTAGLGLGTGG